MKRARMLALLLAVPMAAGMKPAAALPTPLVPCAEIEGINDRCPDWVFVHDHPAQGGAIVSHDTIRAAVLSPGGDRLYLTALSSDDATGKDYLTLSVDTATGSLVWSARHHSPEEGGERPVDVAVSPDGSRVFVTGVEDWGVEGSWGPSPDDSRIATVAYTAETGSLEWRAVFEGPGNSTDFASSVVASPGGDRVYVSGVSRDVGGVVLAYGAASGAEVWSSVRPGFGRDTLSRSALPLAVSPDGSRVYAAGDVADEDEPSDYAVVAYEGSDPERLGEELWSIRHRAPGAESVRELDVSPDGSSLAIAGRSEGAATTLALDAGTGEVRWAEHLTGTGDAIAVGVAMSPDSRSVFVTGRSLAVEPTPSVGDESITVAYDLATGAEAWRESFVPPGTPFQNPWTELESSALDVSPDGTAVYVAAKVGLTSGSGGGGSGNNTPQVAHRDDTSAIVTIAYGAADGSRRWSARFDDMPQRNVAYPGEVVAGEERVFVAGLLGRNAAIGSSGETSNYSDVLTLAYARSGGSGRTRP